MVQPRWTVALLVTLVCAGILFLSTLTRSTFGFGDALLAMPLLTLVVGVRVATPLVGIVSLVVATMIVARRWRGVQIDHAWRLVVASVAGIPLGVLSLATVPERIVVMVLGAFLVLFGLYQAFRPTLPELRRRAWAFPFGFVSGFLGGAYNTGGPPIVVYGVLKRWEPERFRSTLQGYFLPTSVVVVTSHAAAGLWTPQVLQLFGLALPGVLVAIWLGLRVTARLPTERFEKLLSVVLVIMGMVLLIP